MAEQSLESAVVSLQSAVRNASTSASAKATQAAQGETVVMGEVIQSLGQGVFRVRLLDAGGNTSKVIGAQAPSNAAIANGTIVSLRISTLRKVPLIVSGSGGGAAPSTDLGVLMD
jgi:translation initiation factor IF-1